MCLTWMSCILFEKVSVDRVVDFDYWDLIIQLQCCAGMLCNSYAIQYTREGIVLILNVYTM